MSDRSLSVSNLYSTIPGTIVQYKHKEDLANYYGVVAEWMHSQDEKMSKLFFRLKEELITPNPVPVCTPAYTRVLTRADEYLINYKAPEACIMYQRLFHYQYHPSYYPAAHSAALTEDYITAFIIAYQAYMVDSDVNSSEIKKLILFLGEKLQLSSESMHDLFSEVIQKCKSDKSWFFYDLQGDYCFRQGDLEKARAAYSKVFETNVSERRWMAAFKMVAACETLDDSRKLFKQLKNQKKIFQSSKTKFSFCKAEIEELIGWDKSQKETLRTAVKKFGDQFVWKIILATLYQSLRNNCGNLNNAIKKAIENYPQKAKLRQMQIQYAYLHDADNVEFYINNALNEVNNSPAVHCEHARFQLCVKKDILSAKQAIELAIQSNPWYGDAYIEWARILLFEEGPDADLSVILNAVTSRRPDHGLLWNLLSKEPLSIPRETLLRGVEHLRSFPSLLSTDSFVYESLFKANKEKNSYDSSKEKVESFLQRKSFIESPLK